MDTLVRFFKRFGYDIAGYTCLLLVLPVGALPGPGGIPLLIVGLSLLSAHNPWAKRFLDYAQKQSDSLKTIFFPEKKPIQLAWDISAVVLFVGAFVISINSEPLPIKIISTIAGAGATTIFMMNRSRLSRLLAKVRKR